MIILNIVISLFEASTLLVEGIDHSFLRFINYSVNFIVFLFTPLIGFLWAVYLDYKIFNTKDRKKQYYFYLSPFIIVAVLSIINIFIPVLFSISDDNMYSREPLILVNTILLFGLLLYVVYLAIKNRNIIDKKILYGAVLFLVFPAIGGAIQMLFYGVSTMFSMFALGVFSTYIALETIGTSRDNLTGLFIRAKASEYMNELIHKQSSFGVLMIDLDDFKKLNDTHGHNVGDKFLIFFGETLMKVFHNDEVVSRFGGDEFIIVKNNFEEEDLSFYQRSIYRELKKNNSNEVFSENLKFSIGCSICIDGSAKTVEELIVEADNNMYLNKADNKNQKRRSSDSKSNKAG
jgi:diguanylate cyclase (GGDEF)-like protein